VNQAEDKYRHIEEFFAAPPTFRQKYYGAKGMLVHYILTLYEKITGKDRGPVK